MEKNLYPEIYQIRRKRFVSQLDESSCLILPNNNHYFRSNDVEYRFRPDSSFFYLTGFEEPNSACIIIKHKKDFEYILFVEPRNKEMELWTGRNIGIEGAKNIYKADKAFPISDLKSKLKELISKSKNIYYPLGVNQQLEASLTKNIYELQKNSRGGIKSPSCIHDSRNIIYKMRLIKDKNELTWIRKAIHISKEAHLAAIKHSRPKMFEYELESIIEGIFRRLGANGPAYPTIVGSGHNATTLHYIKNNRLIKNGDLILIDAGAEYNYYASDITRTFPANKKFSGPQKDIYEIVLKAQTEAIKQIKPGKRFIDPHNKAVTVIVEGLKELKLLKGSTEKIIRKEEYKQFFMHKLSHWLGLDVHDAGPYTDKKGDSIKLSPGMVLTVEPGIYISNQSKVPKRFKGIGIRIEDDVLVTKDGNEVLTREIPKSIEDLESLRAI